MVISVVIIWSSSFVSQLTAVRFFSLHDTDFPHRLRVRAQYTNSLKQTFLSYKPFLQDVYERSADSVACDLGESREDTRVALERRQECQERRKKGSPCNSLHCRRYLIPVSNVCKAAPRSEIPTDSMNYRKCVSNFLSTQLANRQIMTSIKRPIMRHTQILVHRLGPRTRILALFRTCYLLGYAYNNQLQ